MFEDSETSWLLSHLLPQASVLYWLLLYSLPPWLGFEPWRDQPTACLLSGSSLSPMKEEESATKRAPGSRQVIVSLKKLVGTV